MDEIHVHKIKKSICAHFAESPCIYDKCIYDTDYYKSKKTTSLFVKKMCIFFFRLLPIQGCHSTTVFFISLDQLCLLS